MPIVLIAAGVILAFGPRDRKLRCGQQQESEQMFKNVLSSGLVKKVATAGFAALTLGAVMTTSSEPAQAYWRGYGPGFYHHGYFGYRPFGYRYGFRPYGYRFGFRPYGYGFRRFGYGYGPYRFGYVR